MHTIYVAMERFCHDKMHSSYWNDTFHPSVKLFVDRLHVSEKNVCESEKNKTRYPCLARERQIDRQPSHDPVLPQWLGESAGITGIREHDAGFIANVCKKNSEEIGD